MSQPGAIGTPLDYTDHLYRVYFEIGDYADFGKDVITSFLASRSKDIPCLSENPDALERCAHGYVVRVPMQIIPELVRELGRKNVAVYQVVRVDGTQMAAGTP